MLYGLFCRHAYCWCAYPNKPVPHNPYTLIHLIHQFTTDCIRPTHQFTTDCDQDHAWWSVQTTPAARECAITMDCMNWTLHRSSWMGGTSFWLFFWEHPCLMQMFSIVSPFSAHSSFSMAYDDVEVNFILLGTSVCGGRNTLDMWSNYIHSIW